MTSLCGSGLALRSLQEQALYGFLTCFSSVQVIKAQHSHQGRGGATIQVELRDVDTGNKITERFHTDEALESLCLTYENQSAMKREDTKWQAERDVWWQDVVTKFPTKCDVEWVDAEDPLFLLYTSGSTGMPKGVLHTSGGYMVYTATTFKYAFDYKPTNIYWCTADCGWITGHSYVTYGPLLNSATVLVFEGVCLLKIFNQCVN